MADWAIEIDLTVRFRDTDAMGHVNNAVYHSYLEMGRIEYFRVCLDMKTPKDYAVILAHQAINFRAPVELNGQLRLGLRTRKIGRSSITHDYTIWDRSSDTLYCDGSSVIVWFDYEKNRSVPVPEKIRAMIHKAEPDLANTPGTEVGS